jgi:hypothetical protein
MDSMKVKQNISFDEQKIKDILTAIKMPKDDFEVSIKQEEHYKYDAVYNYKKHKITLYSLNYNSNNIFIGCAIHEYAHHFMGRRVSHATEFWECYFELLKTAENKGFYSCDIDKSDKLKKITVILKQYNLIKNRKIIKKELQWIFSTIKKLCDEIDIDFQYYTVKYLEMDWYKMKIPYLSYGNFLRNNIIYYRNTGDRDELLDNFFNKYCI